MTGRVFNLSRYAVHDGPGIRVTVFMQGCPLRCWWCHNPESQACEGGRVMTAGQVLDEIDRDRLFMDESGGGVTFSGGEPLFQPEFLLAMLQECRRRELHTAVDTSGHAPAEVLRRIAPAVDLFLYDLKIMDDAEHLRHVGASNRDVLANLRLLDERAAKVTVRFPVVPAVTDGRANVEAMAAFLCGLRHIREIHLLPFHRFAAAKYRRLGIANRAAQTPEPSAEQMRRLAAVFAGRGLEARVGG